MNNFNEEKDKTKALRRTTLEQSLKLQEDI